MSDGLRLTFSQIVSFNGQTEDGQTKPSTILTKHLETVNELHLA